MSSTDDDAKDPLSIIDRFCRLPLLVSEFWRSHLSGLVAEDAGVERLRFWLARLLAADDQARHSRSFHHKL